MFKKTIVGTLVLLFIGCSVHKTESTTKPISSARVPPYQVASSASKSDWVHPSQPCPDDLCAIPDNPHAKDTTFTCTNCRFSTIDNLENICPDNMVEVNGDYCPVVQQRCLYMVDNKGVKTNEPIDPNGRCGEWANPVKCLVPKVHKRFCIDKYELPNEEGAIPHDWMTWYDVKEACETEGKRMCTRSEWTFAAEGPNMHPYPYGDGFHRDRTICNFDQHIAEQPATIRHVHTREDGQEYITIDRPTGDDIMKVSSPFSDTGQALRNMLVPSGSKELCMSEWGVYDMPGNIDEWVVNESGQPYVSGLMGGHVFGVRNASRPMTDAHGPTFKWYETGGRCCTAAKD